jgi:O-antigen ligase
VFFVMYVAIRSKIVPRRRLLHLAAVGAVLILASSLLVGTYLSARFGTIGVNQLSDDSSAFGRAVMFVGALKDIGEHPIFGSGTGSFQVLFAAEDYFPEMAGQAYNFIENIFLRSLHDTGIVGLGILFTLIAFVVFKVRRLTKNAMAKSDPLLIGLSAALLVDLIAFQFSDGSSLSFAWVHLGLLVSLVRLLETKAAPSIAAVKEWD